MQEISVIVITYNEEHNVERCLRSVRWADEIIVVDAFSTDKTVEICRRLNAKVIQRKWEGFALQKQFALSSASHSWVLLLDADEEVPADLRKEIESVLSSQPNFVGYEITRKSFFLGKWMQYGGWYPGYELRLFRHEKVRMNVRQVHGEFDVAGRVSHLSAALLHYTYNSIHQYIEKMNAYTSLDVLNELGDRSKRIRWYHFVLNSLSAFLRMFISLKGYRDGVHGFLLAYYSGLSAMVSYSKCWEYQSAQRAAGAFPPVSPEQVTHFKQLI